MDRNIYSLLGELKWCMGSQALDTVVERRQRIEGYRLCRTTYAKLISCLTKAGRPYIARLWFNIPQRHGVATDIVAYNTAIHACAKSQQWQRALQLMEDMQGKGVPADTITYNTAISACAKGGQWQRALQLMGDMQSNGIPVDTRTYTAAISACEKGWQWQRALQVMEGTRGKYQFIVGFNKWITLC